MSQLKSH